MHRLIDYLFVNVSAKINQNQCMCVKVGLQQATLLKFFLQHSVMLIAKLLTLRNQNLFRVCAILPKELS